MPRFSYLYKGINQAVSRAIHTYDMIHDGDRIAVGLSGGKDSWALLWLLLERQKRILVRYSLFPVHVDPGFPGGAARSIEDFSRKLGCPSRIEQTDYGIVAHSAVNRENPCFLCSRLRRKRLFEVAAELGCNKIALGHNQDDLIETFFINILYGAQIRTIRPSQEFFGGKLTVIRPLAFTDERAISSFAVEMKWPVVQNPCPSAGDSQRSQVRSMLLNLYQANRNVKGNIFCALQKRENGISASLNGNGPIHERCPK